MNSNFTFLFRSPFPDKSASRYSTDRSEGGFVRDTVCSEVGAAASQQALREDVCTFSLPKRH